MWTSHGGSADKENASSSSTSTSSMHNFLHQCSTMKQKFNDFCVSREDEGLFFFARPLNEVDGTKSSIKVDRETRLLQELEMYRRSGDMRMTRLRRRRRNGDDEEDECVFLNSSFSSSAERRRREKMIAYRMKIWSTIEGKEEGEGEKNVVLFDNLTEDKTKSGKKVALAARVDADPSRTSDGFQLRGVSLALAAEAERILTTNPVSDFGDNDVLKIEMRSNVAFKHMSMNKKCDTFKEILKRVDANAKLVCEVRLVEAFEIIEIHELSTYEKYGEDDKVGALAEIEIEEERRPRSAVLKRVVEPGESWETPSDFSEVMLRINDMTSKNNAQTFTLKRHETKKDSYERFLMALVKTMRKKETAVAFVPKERFLDFAFPQHGEARKVVDAIRKNNSIAYDYEGYVAIEVHLIDWVSARDCFGDGKVIKTVLKKNDPSKSFPNDSPVQDTKVYVSNLCASAKTTTGSIEAQEIIVGSVDNNQIGEDFSFRLASGEMPRALETALRTACVGETIRVTVDMREEERTAFARKQRKQRMHSYLDSYIMSETLSEIVSRDDQNLLEAGGGFRLVQVTFECTLTGFDKIVNWYSDDVAICLKDGEDLKADANLLFKNGMLVEALEKYESVTQKLNQLASRALLEEEEGKNESCIVALRNNVLLNAAITAKKLRDFTGAKKHLEKIPEDKRSFKAKMLKGCILVDENEFDLAKEAFRELLTEVAAEGKEGEETRGEKKKEIERELARVKQFQKRALEEMRNKFRGKL